MPFTDLQFPNTNASSACRKHCRRMRLPILVTALAIALIPPAHATAPASSQSETAEVEKLMARVAPPPQGVIDKFKEAGMEDIRPHILTAPEQAKVLAALTSLPTLHRRVLEQKLHSLAFVDGIPGDGTGLTSRDETKGSFDITLRASVIDESLSTFLTNKERRVFIDDGSGDTVTLKGTGTDALTFVLLHESTHVVDFTCGITSDLQSRFVAE